MQRTGTLALILLLCAWLGSTAWAAAAGDPPARVARLGETEGAVSLAPAGDDEWVDAGLSRPLQPGDRVWTDRGARAEMQAGSSSWRLDGLSQLEVRRVDDRALQFTLRQGSLALRVRDLPEGEDIEVDTPELAWRVAYPGDFRLDVDPVHGSTRVTVLAGAGSAYGEGGRAMPLGAGQQLVFKGRALGVLASRESPPDDGFDRWVAERNRREDQSIAARHVPRALVGYQQLDAAGQWREDPALGALWLPSSVPPGWAPFRMGHWSWIAPWGWTWLDDAPWGFATSHYGRWTQVQGRWAWAPGALALRPVYAPAVVAFAAAPGGGGLTAWFPLAPGEPWKPAYAASADYLAAANPRLPAVAAAHAWQRQPQAVSVARGDLAEARPVAAAVERLALARLGSADAPPPPRRLLAARGSGPAAAGAPAAGTAVATASAAAPAAASVAAAAPVAPAASTAVPAASATDAVGPAASAPSATAAASSPGPASVPAAGAAAAPAMPTAPAPASAPALAQATPAAPPAAAAAPAPSSASAVAAASPRRAAAGPGPSADAPARPGVAVAAAAPAPRAVPARTAAARRPGRHRGGPQLRRQAREQQLAIARRAAERDARALRRQRQEAEALAAWQRRQQAISEQFQRDQQAWDLRQRGIPILRAGPPG